MKGLFIGTFLLARKYLISASKRHFICLTLTVSLPVCSQKLLENLYYFQTTYKEITILRLCPSYLLSILVLCFEEFGWWSSLLSISELWRKYLYLEKVFKMNYLKLLSLRKLQVFLEALAHATILKVVACFKM